MDALSEKNLLHVHPALCNVIRGAQQMPIPFVVVYGLRTEAAEHAAVASGHSQTMHSRHLPQSHENMYSCAVDVAKLTDGKPDWLANDAKEMVRVFTQIAKQVQASADALRVPIQWGGAAIGAWVPGVVSHFHDWGHFQLPWSQYP